MLLNTITRHSKQVSCSYSKIRSDGSIFDIGLNVGNVRTCADTNGNNFWNTEIAQGFLHSFSDKGLHFAAV